MKFEKICEYFNDIGILEINNIDTFLRIYSQLNNKRFRNEMEQLKLALFSYIKTVSKNDSQLYNLCKNIVDGFTNNRIVQKYRSLYMINNILKTKLISKYAHVFNKLNKRAFKNQKKYTQTQKRISPKKTYYIPDQDFNSFDNIMMQNNNNFQNKSKKNYENNNQRNYNKNNDNNTYLIEGLTLDDIDNCTFKPKINKNYRSNINILKNNYNNFSSDYNDNIEINKRFQKSYYTPYENNNSNILNNINNSINNSGSKTHPFKNYYNYGNNNKINKEIEKLLYNLNMYGDNTINSSFNKKNNSKKNNFQTLSSKEPYYEMPEDNNSFFDNYDFYQNQRDHLERVNDKIKNLEIEKMNKISKECTFFPKINKLPNFYKYNDDMNIYYKNNFRKIKNDATPYNINQNLKKSYSSKNIYKNLNSVKKEYFEDYNNIHPELNNSKKKKRSRSANEKIKKNETSVYKMRAKELEKYYKEKYSFSPNIKNSEKYKVKTTFEDRQKKYLEDKAKAQKQKEEDEKREIEELQKRYINIRAKTNSKEVVGRLYDKEAKIIKERIKLEKERNKKKVIIDWNQRNKENNCKYTDSKNYKKIKSPSHQKTLSKKVQVIVDRLANDSKNKNKKNLNDEKKEQIKDFGDFNQEKNNNNDDEDKKQVLMDKIKDEHNIGFKNGGNLKDINKVNEDVKEVNGNENLHTNNEEESTNFMNMEEKANINNFNGNLLDNLSNNVGIKSKAFQEMLNKYHDK